MVQNVLNGLNYLSVLNSYMIVNAPLLIVIVGPTIMIVAPLPLEIKTPASLTTIDAPVVLRSVMPPVTGAGGGSTGGGTAGAMSLMMMAFCNKD